MSTILSTPNSISDAAQQEKLSTLIPRWLKQVPLYQHLTPAISPRQEIILDSLPLITKKDIRNGFPQNFLSPDLCLETLLDEELVELEHTSGTSEQQTPLLLGQGWWLAQEQRALRLNRTVARILNNTPQARRATISSPVCNSEVCFTGVPPLSERKVGNTLFSSLSRQPFLWSEAELERIVTEILDWKPCFLDTDPVYGVAVALFCERHQIKIDSLRFIICTYEFVSTLHRRILQRAFGVPVFNLYGSTETGHLMMENEEGEMVPALENAFLETLEADPCGVAPLVVTTLTNDYMPLIRYRIGDLVRQSGKGSGATYIVHGREADAFVREGKRHTIWHIDRLVSQKPGMVHYQLIERANDKWLFRYVPDVKPISEETVNELAEWLAEELKIKQGIQVQKTDALLPESSGKFKLCHPSPVR